MHFNATVKIKNYLISLRDQPSKKFEAPLHSSEEGNQKIYDLISSDQPCMISRFGSTELSLIYFYYTHYGDFRQIKWHSLYKNEINHQSGFFPATDKMLSKFCKLFIDYLKSADMMGQWNKPGEKIMISKFCPSVFLAPLESLEPYYFSEPWSRVLEGKKVLIIHPFAETIENQYRLSRDKLFLKNILPKFELSTIKAIQSLGTTKTQFADWFEAFEYMCMQIDALSFDVAIIGAGAYGLPLAGYIKKTGGKAIHLGGATQLLFGIKGRRWDERPEVANLYNSFWTRPSSAETPAKENLLEDGCYW